jgi:hypothetical protein
MGRESEVNVSRGDHLFYYRAGSSYSHHGIYCGEGNVIHYESTLWMKLAGTFSDRDGDLPTVKRVPLDQFSLGAPLFVRGYAHCDHAERVMQRAESRLGEADYDLFENNCEHFAVWCKTGLAHSTQVEAHRQASQAVIQGTPVAIWLLRAARRVPGPYRTWAYVGAAAAAGSIYLGTYFGQRHRHRRLSHS